MDLKTYTQSERGAASRLASALGVRPVMVSQWTSGLKSVPAERCPEIERATAGAVTCEELRPDVAWDVLREQARSAVATRVAQVRHAPDCEPLANVNHPHD